MKKILFTGMMMLITLCALSQNVPKTLSFQGYLTNKVTKDPLIGTFDMRVSLHDKLTGGEELWFEEFSGVSVDEGLYYLVLGEKTPFDEGPFDLKFDMVYYLEVKVGVEVMTPRLQLTSSAYDIAGTNASNIVTGNLDGSLVNTGISATNVSSGDLNSERLDEDLRDLADGSLTGTKVSPDFGAQNIVTTGNVNANAITAGSFTGDGSALSLISAGNINGTVAVGKGGTGATTLTGVVFGNGTSAFTALSSGTAARYLRTSAPNTYEFGALNILSADIADGTVTSNDINDNSIVNADINSSANIADSKLATISTAGKVLGGAITSGQITGTTSVNTSGNIVTTGYVQAGPGAPSLFVKKLTGNISITTAGGTVPVAHGLSDISRIVSVSVLLHSTVTSQLYSPGIKITGGNSEFYWTLNSTVVNLIFVNANCANLISGTARILVEYEP